MALRGDDAQASYCRHTFMVGGPLGAQAGYLLCLGGSVQRRIGFYCLHQFLDIPSQHDVGTAPGHIGGDGDHLRAPGLRHNIGLACMLLGVQHLMWQLLPVQQLGDDLGVLDRGGTNQHWLAALMALADVLDCGFVFFPRCLVHAVKLVVTSARPVVWHDYRFKAVNFLELISLGVGRAGHAGQLSIKPEVVLERN